MLTNILRVVVLVSICSCGPLWVEPILYSVHAPTEYTTAGYNIVKNCLSKFNKPIYYSENDIQLFLVEGNSFGPNGKVSDKVDLQLGGIATWRESPKIFVVRPYKDISEYWAHEYLHVVGKIVGHPQIFELCGVQLN